MAMEPTVFVQKSDGTQVKMTLREFETYKKAKKSTNFLDQNIKTDEEKVNTQALEVQSPHEIAVTAPSPRYFESGQEKSEKPGTEALNPEDSSSPMFGGQDKKTIEQPPVERIDEDFKWPSAPLTSEDAKKQFDKIPEEERELLRSALEKRNSNKQDTNIKQDAIRPSDKKDFPKNSGLKSVETQKSKSDMRALADRLKNTRPPQDFDKTVPVFSRAKKPEIKEPPELPEKERKNESSLPEFRMNQETGLEKSAPSIKEKISLGEEPTASLPVFGKKDSDSDSETELQTLSEKTEPRVSQEKEIMPSITKKPEHVVAHIAFDSIAPVASVAASRTYMRKPVEAQRVKGPNNDYLHEVSESQFSRGTVGPVDEYAIFTLEDFRRLAIGTPECLKKMEQKIDALKNESFVLFMEAVAVWKKSPLYLLYLEHLNQAIENTVFLRETVDTTSPKSLSYDEIRAINQINKKFEW